MEPDKGGLSSTEHQQRVREIVQGLVQAGVRRIGTQQQTVELLDRLGWKGRGGERISQSAVSGWVRGENMPNAGPLFGLVLELGLSVDEVAHGTGLRAEVEELRSGLEVLAGIVSSRQFSDLLEPEQAEQLGRIARPVPPAC